MLPTRYGSYVVIRCKIVGSHISRVQGPRTEILTIENQKQLTEFLLPNL